MCVRYVLFFLTVIALLQTFAEKSDVEMKMKRAKLVRKHLKRLKKVDGGIKLVGGRAEYEGNVEILHNGQWGAICDDEWDAAEAEVVCRQLGYSPGAGKPTYSSQFGPARRHYWMDNVFCDGSEAEITDCRFDGWGENDCDANEAAGVICQENGITEEVDEEGEIENRRKVLVHLPENLEMRLRGGRFPKEGRVEIKPFGGSENWQVICGDGWSILEAMVVCRALSLGYANDAIQTDFFGGNLTNETWAEVKCTGRENSLSECLHDPQSRGECKSHDFASVYCTDSMADLVIDHVELTRTAHLEDRQMFFLQCAMEENCLASHAYTIQKESSSWHLETRRLLRFTASIFNAGTADFRSFIPKHLWEWHMCHMHYHSMEVFATFDIYNDQGIRVAEGHKASFCLEDNQCLPGVKPKYACANYGDQGISPNCTDIYKYTVDCQWVDISDIEPGVYTLKVAVNPEFKVPEITYENNAAVCQFYYSETYGRITNCTLQRP